MSSFYSGQTASHYRAYRPPLHQLVLAECLSGLPRKRKGLDIGCGTGHSAIALSRYCREVHGLEPSENMLASAISHPGVHYHYFDEKHLDFESSSADVITLAGSWYYAQSRELLDEMHRVSRPNAHAIVYDFRSDIRSPLQAIGLPLPDSGKKTYDYRANFSSYQPTDFHIKAEWN
ncbi:MAG: class I SAM-dependent methyltransferase, partial [Bacteroidota bacterium]